MPRAIGWGVKVTHPSNGLIRKPTVIGKPERNPKANALPSLQIPIRRDESWLDQGWEGATLEVWFDGEKQPVDEVENIELQPGRTVLAGRGGLELETRVTKDYNQESIHTAAKNLIQNNTSYTANVDTPTKSTETNTELASYTTTADFKAQVALASRAEEAWEVSSGTLKALQSLYFSEGEDPTTESGTTQSNVNDYSDGFALRLNDASEEATWDFTIDYTIPEEHVGVKVREDNEDGAAGYNTKYYLNGEQIDVVTGDLVFGWKDHASGNFSSDDGWTGGDLTAGTHTVKIDCDRDGTWHDIDCVVLYDKRFSYNFDDTTDSDDHLSGPELYPDGVDVLFQIVPSSKAATGARADVTMNDTGGSGLNLHLSNDQGDNFTSGITTDTSTTAHFETDSLNDTHGPGVTFKITLGRWGSRTSQTPTSGFNGHQLEDVTIKADLETMPLVVNQSWDDHLINILSDLAQQGDFVFSFDRDGSTESVEWTQAGQRTSSKTPDVSDYSSEKSTAEVYEKVAVFGSAQRVTGIKFESAHDTAVPLAKDRLHELKERVYDADTGEDFVRERDYTMDYSAGEITVLSTGEMSDATEYTIDYTWQTFGEYDTGAPSPTEAPPQEIPGLTSDRQCMQAARIIVEAVKDPSHAARVVVPNDESGWSVVDEISFDEVPTDGQSLHIRDVENTPRETVLLLENRQQFGDIVSDIKSRVGAVARKA